MSYIKFLNNDEHLDGVVRVVDEHTIEVTGCNQNLSGLQWFADSDICMDSRRKKSCFIHIKNNE